MTQRVVGNKATLRRYLSAMTPRLTEPKPGARLPELTVWVTAHDVMRVRGCSRRSAYRFLVEARGGRRGLTTLVEWEAYAHRRWGGAGIPWDDRDKKSLPSASAAMSGTRPSTSVVDPSSAVPASEPKPRPLAWLRPGSKVRLRDCGSRSRGTRRSNRHAERRVLSELLDDTRAKIRNAATAAKRPSASTRRRPGRSSRSSGTSSTSPRGRRIRRRRGITSAGAEARR